MAQKTVTDLVDDISGGTENVTTVQFNYRGVAYSVDLDDANAEAFDEAMTPFIEAARRVGGIRQEVARSSQPSDTQAIRAWAAENGVEVQPRGRISAEVRRQYEAAQRRRKQ